ncbi:ubiquinone biosynthesis UbiH/UbiF/VisC/COQ6 family hydroxylase [Paucibacter oligotrophus]|uniref:Ubiquinone biosynthesis UbiH/UbiF/VisC/COQ6 family hydroxylase n=1 Tax=Roseateles oligotrophus TaxID=1769250 RepID=A0A840L8M8_9BURK|nr:5-demethoxyubiquinol-8 5-hydroxylase UbiM [Roseateles oligotrophus]MBB4841737.1 ubiquinone biosynthesis UbiH/UbiF/VisC/COQ6 family hydroxylase [Roseateles oligotrophus]
MHKSQSPSLTSSPDVLIVGAGPAGLSMACALADAGIRSCVLEAAPLASLAAPAEDGREIALTHQGIAILKALGQWDEIPAEEKAPLRQAHVFNGQGEPGAQSFLGFDAQGSGGDLLGQLVANHWLRQVAYQGALRRGELIEIRAGQRVAGLSLGETQASVTLDSGETLSAPLAVAADSRFSATRRAAGIGAQMRDFGRSVLLCRLQHSQPNQGIALECFHYGHTLALLPLNGDRSSLVLTIAADQASEMMAWDEARFLAWVRIQVNGRLGDLSLAGPRHLYPLVATYAHRFATQRLALVGDAAVGMHPVTAHGYNFGLYSVELLARILDQAKKKGQDLGDAAVLQHYAAEHRRRTWTIYQGTNAVVRLFTDDRPAARLLRRGVIQAAQHLPPLKAAITAQLTGRRPGFLRQLQALRADLGR